VYKIINASSGRFLLRFTFGRLQKSSTGTVHGGRTMESVSRVYVDYRIPMDSTTVRFRALFLKIRAVIQSIVPVSNRRANWSEKDDRVAAFGFALHDPIGPLLQFIHTARQSYAAPSSSAIDHT
jgi:hypothetical protein